LPSADPPSCPCTALVASPSTCTAKISTFI
jgi:hypothetical protein